MGQANQQYTHRRTCATEPTSGARRRKREDAHLADGCDVSRSAVYWCSHVHYFHKYLAKHGPSQMKPHVSLVYSVTGRNRTAEHGMSLVIRRRLRFPVPVHPRCAPVRVAASPRVVSVSDATFHAHLDVFHLDFADIDLCQSQITATPSTIMLVDELLCINTTRFTNTHSYPGRPISLRDTKDDPQRISGVINCRNHKKNPNTVHQPGTVAMPQPPPHLKDNQQTSRRRLSEIGRIHDDTEYKGPTYTSQLCSTDCLRYG